MIILFSTNCPKCNILEHKLQDAGINFEIQNDVQEVIDAGFMTAPILKVDNTYYEFGDAVKWVNTYAN